MSTRVAYTYKNQYRTEFVDPIAAYKILEKWSWPNFDDFIIAPRGVLNPVIPPDQGGPQGPLANKDPPIKVFKLYIENSPGVGKIESGVVMCGTTQELKASLRRFAGKKDGVKGFAGDVASMDKLLACYVRVQHQKEPIKTLISIGPLGSWWKPLTKDIYEFEPSPWRKFMSVDEKTDFDEIDFYSAGIGFVGLAERLDQCEKPNKEKGEKQVPVIPV